MSGDTVAEEQPTKKRLPAKSEIDLQALAERIVQLMKKDVRLEKERLGQHKAWSKR